MMHAARFLLPALLLALPSAPASAAVPASLSGEWFSGPQYAAGVYTTEFGAANADARRLLLNKDGTYVYTEFESTQYPSSFGTTGYPITCQMMDVTVERGTFTVQGGNITFKAAKVDRVGAYSPDRLNNGCKRNAGTRSSRPGSGADTLAWSVASGKLTVKAGKDAAVYVRRTPGAPPAPAASTVSPELGGEWHSGRISPVEYYNTATGKWAEASGTSVILKFGPNFTYERTGLMVVTTYGCTSKLLVQEKGKVAQNGNTLTFTPSSSAATGYTCSASKVSSAKDHVKPYSEQYQVRTEPNGQRVLSLSRNGAQTLFNRPLGSKPEGAVTSRGGVVTPPPPASSGSGAPAAGPVTPAAPARWTATGRWDAVITVNGRTVQVRLTLQDDSPRILGYGDDPVEYANGNSQTGALDVGLDLGGDTMELKVQGRFDGDRYQGTVRWTNYEGEDLGRGTLTMTRQP